MAEVPSWVGVLSALLTPMIGIVGLALGIYNYWLALRRRRDELFDRRYQFYQRVRSMWLKTGNGARPGQRDWLDMEELIPIADEAEFLFGQDISQHIVSLAEPPFSGRHSGHPDFPNDDFVDPFRKYLCLGGQDRVGSNKMKNTLFVMVSWGLIGMAWAFTVLHVVPALDEAASDQKYRHQLYEPKLYVGADGQPIDFSGFQPLDAQWERIERPTWPVWAVFVVGVPAAIAAKFPFWTIVGGIGGGAWAYFRRDNLMQRRRAKEDSRNRCQSGDDPHE